MKKIALFLIASSLLFGACNKDEQRNALCNCSGLYYKFKAGGATLIYPNAFTPNGDGRNDKFRPIHSSIQSTGYTMNVYNSAKEVVFSTNNLYDGWDGQINGSYAPVGQYEAVFSAMDVNNNSIESCTCVQLLAYEQAAGCLRVSPGSFQFEDMFDVNAGEPSFQTSEYLCP